MTCSCRERLVSGLADNIRKRELNNTRALIRGNLPKLWPPTLNGSYLTLFHDNRTDFSPGPHCFFGIPRLILLAAVATAMHTYAPLLAARLMDYTRTNPTSRYRNDDDDDDSKSWNNTMSTDFVTKQRVCIVFELGLGSLCLLGCEL